MATILEKGNLKIQPVVELKKDRFHQVIPAQDMLHELQPLNQISLRDNQRMNEKDENRINSRKLRNDIQMYRLS